MKEQLIEKLKNKQDNAIINGDGGFQISNEDASKLIQALTSVKSESAEEVKYIRNE